MTDRVKRLIGELLPEGEFVGDWCGSGGLTSRNQKESVVGCVD